MVNQSGSLKALQYPVYACLACILSMLFCSPLLAQTEKKHVREGNKLYSSGKFNDAEISYRKALEKNKKSFQGTFNLGDALYKQGNMMKRWSSTGVLPTKLQIKKTYRSFSIT